MSLINNMLKDLERRENRTGNITYMPFRNTHNKYYYLRTISYFVSIIAIFAVFTFLFTKMFFTHPHSRLSPFANENTQILQASAHTIDKDWKNTINITGITMQNKDNLTEVTLLLDHNALYRLVSDEMQNQLIIYIDRSQLKSEIPVGSFGSKAINKIAASEVKGDTKLTISLNAGSTIKYVTENDVNGHPELVIAAQAENITPTATPKPTTANPNDETVVKSPVMQSLLTDRYQNALQKAEAGHYQLAMQDLVSLLKLDPDYKDARVSLIALLIDQDKLMEAEKMIQVGLQQNPEFIPFIELKARILALNGKYKLALNTLRSRTPNIDENPEYHAFIAAMYQQNNDYSLAASLYRQLLAINSNNSSWWFGLGVSLDKLNQEKNAIDAYQHALNVGHLSPESTTYLQSRLRKLEEARDDKE